MYPRFHVCQGFPVELAINVENWASLLIIVSILSLDAGFRGASENGPYLQDDHAATGALSPLDPEWMNGKREGAFGSSTHSLMSNAVRSCIRGDRALQA